MKFSDGFWLTKRGYDISYAVQPYEITITDHAVTVLATSAEIFNRAMTLGGVTLEITFSSTRANVIKVSVRHFKGVPDRAPRFELNEDGGDSPEITETDDRVTLLSGDTLLTIQKGKQWRVSYSYKERHLTGCGWRSTSYIQENGAHADQRLDRLRNDAFWGAPCDNRRSYLREQLTLSVGECIYGFGERFTPFVKNGQSIETWNADGGTCSAQSYKSIPFFLSSRGYGVLVNSADRVSYEVASDTVSAVSFTLPGETLTYFLIGGETPGEVLCRYTALAGRPALPPANTFGLWLSTSFTTEYDEKTVNAMVDGMAQRQIPLQMFHFDCFWMKEYEWTSFAWDARRFPHPAELLERLKGKKQNFGLCCWINPYIAQRSPLFEEGLQNGFFLKRPDGSVFQTDMWQPGMAIVDFTNPAARAWFADGIRQLCEMGITAIKTDFGERIPTDVVYFDGADPIAMHNYYSYLYNKTVFEALEQYGTDAPCLFARSATVGGQKFPVHWGGDCCGTYASMAETLRGGLSLCASGFGFFSHDIGGFEAHASADVYKRWCAFGLLSTHSRLHGSTSYRVPWVYDDEAVDVLRFFTQLKGRLMPYLFAQAVKAHKTGAPMLRAMVLDYADDPACLTLDRQYMLGDSLLCAPILNEAGTADIYLPAGIWKDIITGEAFVGGRYITRTCNYFQMPVFAKPGAMIPYGAFADNFVYDYLTDAELVIYALADGNTAQTEIYDADASLLTTVTAVRSGNAIHVTYTRTDRPFRVTAAGKTVEADGSGTLTLTL